MPARIQRWNSDKPHRCPECHSIAVSGRFRPRSWRRYTCCRCATEFTRWPRLLGRLAVPARRTCYCHQSHAEVS